MSAEKVIILTGASSGIGYEAAKKILGTSHRLVIVARSRDKLEAIRSIEPDRVRVVAGDFAEAETARKAVDTAINVWGRLDAVVANHGLLEAIAPVAEAQLDEWNHMYKVNVFSVVSLMKAALPALRETRGKFIVTSAGAAVYPISSWSCYGATKASLNYIVSCLKKEEERVVCVALDPGVTSTPMLDVAKAGVATMTDDDRKGLEAFWEHQVINPELPGTALVKLALHAPQEMSGEFIRYDDKRISALPHA